MADLWKRDFAWQRHPLLRYSLAVGAVGFAVGIASVPAFHLSSAPVSLFLCAIMLAVWFGGAGPGLAAGALAVLAFDFVFLSPSLSFTLRMQELPRLISFCVSALLVGSLTATQRRAAESLRAARDALARTVEDLGRTNDALRAENAERVHAEETARRAQSELAHVARVTTLGEMAASIAHEVDQPLSGVVINANACLRFLNAASPDLDEVRDGLRAISRDGRRASDVIARIRALARGRPGDKEPLDIGEVVGEVVALAQGEARRTQARLTTDVAGDLPRVNGDRVQLQQVVLNLLLNGFEAMTGNGERPRELTIGVRSQGGRVQVSVRDSGSGIDPQLAPRIFEAFYTTKPRGLGMGLSISRTILEQHGGRLWAEANADGPGTTFHFTV